MYYLLNIISYLLNKLPDGAINKLAEALTWLSWDVLRVRRVLVETHLSLAFPEKTQEQRLHIGHACWNSFFLTVCEFMRGRHRDMVGQITFKDRKFLDQALAKGQGAYVLCCHLGNWEVMSAAVSRLICPAHVLVKTVGGKGTNRFVADVRARTGFLAIKRERRGDGYKSIIKALKAGEIVGFVMDQSRPGEPKVPFFGRPAKTNTGLATIWRRRPAMIVPGFTRRIALGQHEVVFLPPLELPLDNPESMDVLTLTELCNRALEQMIRQAPEQYFWLHNRWKE